MVGDDQLDRVTLEKLEAVFARVSGQHTVAHAGEQQLPYAQRDVGVVNAQNEARGVR